MPKILQKTTAMKGAVSQTWAYEEGSMVWGKSVVGREQLEEVGRESLLPEAEGPCVLIMATITRPPKELEPTGCGEACALFG